MLHSFFMIFLPCCFQNEPHQGDCYIFHYEIDLEKFSELARDVPQAVWSWIWIGSLLLGCGIETFCLFKIFREHFEILTFYQWWSLETWSWSRVVSRDPFFQVSVSNDSGLVSVSKNFGFGLKLLVSRLRMSYFFMKSCKKQLLKNGFTK